MPNPERPRSRPARVDGTREDRGAARAPLEGRGATGVLAAWGFLGPAVGTHLEWMMRNMFRRTKRTLGNIAKGTGATTRVEVAARGLAARGARWPFLLRPNFRSSPRPAPGPPPQPRWKSQTTRALRQAGGGGGSPVSKAPRPAPPPLRRSQTAGGGGRGAEEGPERGEAAGAAVERGRPGPSWWRGLRGLGLHCDPQQPTGGQAAGAPCSPPAPGSFPTTCCTPLLLLDPCSHPTALLEAGQPNTSLAPGLKERSWSLCRKCCLELVHGPISQVYLGESEGPQQKSLCPCRGFISFSSGARASEGTSGLEATSLGQGHLS